MLRKIATGVARNTSIMMFQQIITWGSTFLLMMFLPRYLGPVEYGRYYLAASILEIFRIFVTYGGNYLVAKEVSRARERTSQILVDAMSFRFVFAIISIIVMVIFAFVIDYPVEVRILLLILGTTLLWQGGLVGLYACYQGHELMQYTSAGVIAERVFMSLAGVTALLLGGGARTLAVIVVIASLLNVLAMTAFARTIVSSLPKVQWKGVVHQLREGVPYFMFGVFSTVYYRIDSVMLGAMTPEEVVGWYGGAFRLFDVMNFLPFIFSTAVYPVLARLWGEHENAHRLTTQKSLQFIVIAGIPLTILIALYAGKVVSFFYGMPQYEPSVIVLQILCAGLLFLYADMVLGTTLLASERQKALSMLSLSAIPLKIGLNYVLIQYFQSTAGNGGIGTAIATAFTEMVIMIVALNLLPKGLLVGFQIRVIFKGLVSGAVMYGLLLLLTLLGIPWFAQIVIGPPVFILTLFWLKTFDSQESEFIRGIFSKRGFQELKQIVRARGKT